MLAEDSRNCKQEASNSDKLRKGRLVTAISVLIIMLF